MNGDNTSSGLVGRLSKWAAAPMNTDMNLVDLALTVLFISTLVFLYWCGFRYISETGDL